MLGHSTSAHGSKRSSRRAEAGESLEALTHEVRIQVATDHHDPGAGLIVRPGVQVLRPVDDVLNALHQHWTEQGTAVGGAG